jgi:two-component system, LuxR family, response regulator FixJ
MQEKTTVFVVDDDDAVRESLQLLLEANGFRVETFANGPKFLEALPPAPHGCALVDVRMPEMGGIEVQQELKRRGIDLPVIVITGHGDVPLAVKAMQAGAADFIEKPFTDETIRAGIERAIALDRAAEDQRSATSRIREHAAQLTAREREVLEHLVAGHPNKVIAHRMSISPRTVEIHRARVMEKMQARSLSELVRMAIEAGLVAT